MTKSKNKATAKPLAEGEDIHPTEHVNIQKKQKPGVTRKSDSLDPKLNSIKSSKRTRDDLSSYQSNKSTSHKKKHRGGASDGIGRSASGKGI